MEQQAFLLDLIRLKFGFMACFHYIFVPLTLGLIVSTACMESAFVWTREAAWRLAAHFWFRLFTVGWLLGIVTGYPLRAQLESDWSNYFSFMKPVLNLVLPIEAALGPVMLLGVGTLAALGQRLYPATRMLLTWLLALTMLCQSATILAVNAWMQHPMGIDLSGSLSHPPTLLGVMTNPMAVSKIAHVFSAALVCGATLICVVAATYVYKRLHQEVANVSLRLGVWMGALSVVLVIITGHFSATHVQRFQPMKFAAFEALWKHEEGPTGLILFARPQAANQINREEIKIPYAMSMLAGYGLTGSPLGIREAVSEQESRIRRALLNGDRAGSRALEGYRELFERQRMRSSAAVSEEELIHRAAMQTIPNVPVLFGGFRAMVFVGLGLLAFYLLALIMLKSVIAGHRRRRLLLVPGILPLPWLASTSGWIVAEMGRQPWAVYGYLPTVEAARLPDLAQGVFATLLVTSLYAVLSCLFVMVMLRMVRRGPGAPLLSASWWVRISAPTPAPSV